jgi:hypothetical protein
MEKLFVQGDKDSRNDMGWGVVVKMITAPAKGQAVETIICISHTKLRMGKELDQCHSTEAEEHRKVDQGRLNTV